nr:hypothetical protein [Tanacetum cinerariifolium]
MVESSSPDITPKEEPVTVDRPKSPNPFLPTIQGVSDFISKCCLKEAFTRAPNQYKEYLSKFWYTAKVLPDSKICVSTPTGEVRGKIGYNGEIEAKGTLKKSCLPSREKIVISLLLEHMAPKYDNEELTINPTQVFSFHNWILKLNQPEEPPFTNHMKAIYNLDVPMDFKAPKYSSLTEEASQSKKPGARRTKTYSFAHILARSNPSVLVDKTKSVIDGLKTANTTSSVNRESGADDISQNMKLEDLVDILKDTRSTLFTPDSLTHESIIISDKKDMEQAKVTTKAEVASLKAKPSYPDNNCNAPLRKEDVMS